MSHIYKIDPNYKSNTISFDVCTKLYSPSTTDYQSAFISFFIINDDWDYESLLTLRNNIKTEVFIALQTTDKSIDNYDFIDSIIHCKPAEVDYVISMLDHFVEADPNQSLAGIDLKDIKTSFNHSQAKYISSKKTKRTAKEIIKEIKIIIEKTPRNVEFIYTLIEINKENTLDTETCFSVFNTLESHFETDINILPTFKFNENIEINSCRIEIIYTY